jgi:hypothetical protein
MMLGNIPQPPKKLFVFPHLEIGDSIICNGMCRVLAERNESLVWVTGSKSLEAVRRMFSDLKNVQVVAALDYGEIPARWMPVISNYLALGYHPKTPFDKTKFVSEFYRQADMPVAWRWDRFALPKDLVPTPGPKRSQVLVHEEPGRGYRIAPGLLPKDLDKVFITRRPSFWDWMPEIMGSAELHFIDSGYLNLVDSLWAAGFLRGTKLVWHKYARNSDPPEIRAPWKIIT